MACPSLVKPKETTWPNLPKFKSGCGRPSFPAGPIAAATGAGVPGDTSDTLGFVEYVLGSWRWSANCPGCERPVGRRLCEELVKRTLAETEMSTQDQENKLSCR